MSWEVKRGAKSLNEELYRPFGEELLKLLGEELYELLD